MKDFVGLIRDTSASKNPNGTWHYSKNIIKSGLSIRNEDGFKFQYLVNGTIIGTIATNSHVVYFHKNAQGVDEIGVVNTNNNTPEYKTILKTNLLNFQLNCPIEGIFVYNYKKELIVSWCDGVYQNSNNPRVLNLNTLPFEVNPDGTLVNDGDFYLINLFPNLKQGNLNISYTAFGVFGGYAVYITFSYVYNDDSLAGYFPLSNLAYVGKGIEPTIQKGLNLEFTDLDPAFNKLRIGLLIRTEAEEGVASDLIAYESGILVYTGTNYSIELSSLQNFAEAAAETLLIEQAYFSKVNTMTKYENQALVGNVVFDSDLKFQKFANLIEIVPFEFIEDADEYRENLLSVESSFMPDEVYSIYIELQLLNGSYTKAYHIPGRIPEEGETDELTEEQIADFGLDWTEDLQGLKQFHIFNNGVVDSMPRPTLSSPNPKPLDESINKFGYWENEEVYPDNDEYNSSVDYEGNVLGGEDLRNTPIRYHRFPSIESMYKQTRNTNGDIIGEVDNPDAWGLPNTGDAGKLGNATIANVGNRRRKLGIRITNIEDIIPDYIKEQIQGYRISHVQRNSNNSYVVGNWIGVRRRDFGDRLNPSNEVANPIDYEYYDFAVPSSSNGPVYTSFEKIRVLGAELFKFRPSLQPSFIRVNYKYFLPPFQIEDGGFTYENVTYQYKEALTVKDEERFSNVRTGLIYRPSNSIIQNTEYSAEGINMNLKLEFNYRLRAENFPEGTSIFDIAESVIPAYVVINLTAYSYKKNVYTGFKSDKLNIVGRTGSITNNTEFKRADNFTDNTFNVYTRGLHMVNNYPSMINAYIAQLFAPITIHGLNSPVNSIEIMTNEPASITTNDAAVLETYEYDFTIKQIESLSSIQNLLTIFTFDVKDSYIDAFPYRIYKGLKIPNESLTLNAISTYLITDYYEMPNDKGEIIALRGSEGALFIQHRFTLFVASIKDKLKTENIDAYLGRSELFERPPEEILGDDKGYIGSVSKFACQVFKQMYVTVNQVTGQIFLIGRGVSEISDKGNKIWFWNNWDNGLDFYYTDSNGEKRRIDNPYISVGHLVGYDKEFNRLLFTKKMYEFKYPNLIGETVGTGIYNFDGEFYRENGVLLEFNDTNYFINKSRTFSYSLESGQESWICEHDYFPNIIFYTSNGLFSVTNKLTGNNRSSVYKHNDKLTKGLFYGNKFSSYVDLIYNQSLDITKLLQSITWISEVINENNGVEQFKTISHIMIYNNHQCSGIINLKDKHFEVTRLAKGQWNLNEFRDLVINPNYPILKDNGELNIENINNLKVWFEKSNFISKFITVRFIMDNVDNTTVYLHEASIKSVIIKR